MSPPNRKRTFSHSTHAHVNAPVNDESVRPLSRLEANAAERVARHKVGIDSSHCDGALGTRLFSLPDLPLPLDM